MCLREIYQEIIIDHGRNPRNYGQLESANYHQLGHNPLCGDRLFIHVHEQAGCVLDARFEGEGCAICLASASLMTEVIKGKMISTINQLFTQFHAMVTKQAAVSDDNMGKLAVFAGIAEYPIRVKCATLAWHTLQAALSKQSTAVNGVVVSTE